MQINVGEEQRPDGEDAIIKDLVALQLAIMQKTDPKRRGQHPKHHGCVTAEFAVRGDIPDPYRAGLFKEPKVYQARIRWSNGAAPDDNIPDVHGMAVKVLQVTGAKALEAPAPDEQDFVMIDNEDFFVPDVQTMLTFMRARAASAVKPEMLDQFNKANPEIVSALAAAKKTIASPLAVRYWSTVPFKLGDQAVKYTAVPADGNASPEAASKGPDFLREVMTVRLADGSGPVSFELSIIPQTDPATMPIENPMKRWGSAPVAVATITVAPQSFAGADQLTQCEVTSFNPWHALAEQRPLGGINRARRAVYEASVKLRHGATPQPQA